MQREKRKEHVQLFMFETHSEGQHGFRISVNDYLIYA